MLVVDINDNEPSDLIEVLPELPKMWGEDFASLFPGISSAPPFESPVLPASDDDGVISVEESDNGVEMSFTLRDLRVGRPPYRLETEFVLVTGQEPGTKFSGEWTLTAADHGHVYAAADVVLEVVDLDLTDWLRDALNEALQE
jgi:hypothetical protein